jgi:hypothetical protein
MIKINTLISIQITKNWTVVYNINLALLHSLTPGDDKREKKSKGIKRTDFLFGGSTGSVRPLNKSEFVHRPIRSNSKT